MQKHFPICQHSLMEWKYLLQESHLLQWKFHMRSHFSVHPFPLFDLSSLKTILHQMAALLSNRHIFIHGLPKNRSAQTEHIWDWETQEKKKPVCSCQIRSELIVWMFLNYIHYFHIHRLTPPQITEPGGSCNVHCLWLEGQLIVSLMSCV